MRVRFQRILGSALLAASFSVPQTACTTYSPAHTGPRPREHVVESCHRSVRAQVGNRFGKSARVGFDTAETYFVSSALEGVRGGGVIRARGDRTRIYYTCSVNVHSGRVVGVEHRLIDEHRHESEWSIDACQDRIRLAVASKERPRAGVEFDSAETWFISLDREGVRGTARLEPGGRHAKIRYECEVDTRRGRIESAHYSPLEKPPLSDSDARKLCQASITDEVEGDRGKGAKISFTENDVYAISRFEKGVRGKANLKSRGDRDPIAYECKVDTRRERVTDARYRLLEEPRPSPEKIVERCQTVTREMAMVDHGRRSSMKFDGGETFSISDREMGVRGSGLLRIGGDHDPIRYSCRVDLRTAKVTDARYRPVEQPRKSIRRTVDMCHAELREQIASDRQESVSLTFESAETFFVSNAVEGVRGMGVIGAGRKARDGIRYECEVDIRRGRVEKASYRYR